MAARSSSDQGFRRGATGTWWRVVRETTATCFRYRVTGLAAEAAFFAVLSLPPLVFALAGAVGFVAQTFSFEDLNSFRGQVLALASRVLTPDVVSNAIAPTIDAVLSGGSVSVISIGFVLSLWSGSRALNVFIDTITIMSGLAGHRGFVKTRVLAFGLYVVFLLAGVVLLPLVLVGPTLIASRLPTELSWLTRFYWPVVLLGSIVLLATLFHVSIPVRARWRAGLPGAALTLVIWLAGSLLLRMVLSASVGSTSIYGPLATPIALLIWLYVLSLAVLVGAAFNAALADIWPRLSGVEVPHVRHHRAVATTTPLLNRLPPEHLNPGVPAGSAAPDPPSQSPDARTRK